MNGDAASQDARLKAYATQREHYYGRFMQKYMSQGLMSFIKSMIDDRVRHVIKGEVKKHMEEAELKLMKFVQQSVKSTRYREAMFEVIKPETERLLKYRSKPASLRSSLSRVHSSTSNFNKKKNSLQLGSHRNSLAENNAMKPNRSNDGSNDRDKRELKKKHLKTPVVETADEKPIQLPKTMLP